MFESVCVCSYVDEKLSLQIKVLARGRRRRNMDPSGEPLRQNGAQRQLASEANRKFDAQMRHFIPQMCSSTRYGYDDAGMAKLLSFIEAFNALGSTVLTGPVAAFQWMA